jgi:hypothetical protein
MKFTGNLRVSFVALLVVVFTGPVLAPAALAGDKLAMKCPANQDRVWVYDALNSFDVSAKLNCGDTVEVVSRVKGFVKIRAANGAEGYVPDSTFPGLPPFEDDSTKPAGLAQIRPKGSARTAAVSTAVPAAPAVAVVVAVAAPVAAAPAPVPAPASGPAKVAANPPVTSAPVRTVAVVAPAHAPAAAAPTSAPVEIVLTTAAEAPAPAPAAAKPVAKSTSSSAKNAAPANAPSVQPASANSGAHAAAAASSGASSAAKPATNASKSANSKSSGSQPPAPGSTHSSPTPAPPATPSNPKPGETTANFQPSRKAASVHPVAATVESEDFPDAQVESESADPSCKIFYSAYGLTPDQIKWMAQNRKRHFANLCPAPDVSHVDFVVIFTHDVDFYGGTLPPPVHTDKNGFSDFSPVMMMDTVSMSLAEAEKAKREYVYVFQMKRGAFDPSRFSPRRRYQFTKAESNSFTSSHASSRTVEDAFHFMEQQGTSH